MTNPMESTMLNPTEAFSRTLHELAQMVELFDEEDTPVTPEDFLAAAHNAGERLKAVCLFSMAGLTTPVVGKIPPEVKANFDSKIEVEEMMMSDEDRQRKMVKLLRSITQPPRG